MWIKNFEQENKGYLEKSPHSGVLENDKAEERENSVEAILIFWLRNDEVLN